MLKSQKLASGLIVAMALSQMPQLNSYAIQNLDLKALNTMSYEVDLNHKNLEKSLDDLWKQRNSALEGTNKIQDTLDKLEHYKVLHDKKDLTAKEAIDLLTYRAMFGKTPPTYTAQEMLDLYIKNRDFPHASLYAEYKKLDNQKNVIKPTLEVSLYGLAVQLADLEDSLSLNKDMLVIQKTKLTNAESKFKKGQLSKVEYEKTKRDYQILELQIENLTHSVETVRMNLNKMVGVSPKEKIQLTQEYLISENYVVKPISEYLEKALVNRMEVKNAQADSEARTREFEIIQEYLKNNLLTDYLSYEVNAVEAQNALETAKNTVEKDIIKLYGDLVRADKALKNQSKSYAKADDDYRNAQTSFKAGLMTKSDLQLAEYQLKSAHNAYKAANRKVGKLIYTMERSTGLGPAYGGK